MNDKTDTSTCGAKYNEEGTLDIKFSVISEPQVSSHPLLNPNSRHYSMVDGVEAIARMESMYSSAELRTWANISAMKYRLRIGAKDDPSKELEKIKTFENYIKYLDKLI